MLYVDLQCVMVFRGNPARLLSFRGVTCAVHAVHRWLGKFQGQLHMSLTLPDTGDWIYIQVTMTLMVSFLCLLLYSPPPCSCCSPAKCSLFILSLFISPSLPPSPLVLLFLLSIFSLFSPHSLSFLSPLLSPFPLAFSSLLFLPPSLSVFLSVKLGP